MKTRYILFAIAMLAISACAKDNSETPEVQGIQMTITASQEGSNMTRTTIQDGGTQVYWEPGDEIKLFYRGTGNRFLSQNTEDAAIAEFSGTMNVVVGINEGTSGDNTLWGLYPYRADATSDGESVTTTLPSEQTGRAGSFAKGTFITLAKSNSFDLAFYNVCGGICFTLTQEGVKEVVFQGQSNEDIAGKVKLTFVDGVPSIQEVIDGQKTITLVAPNGGTFEPGKWYYIVTIPGTFSNGYKMTFNTADKYATLEPSGSRTIKRGIFGTLANADEDLIYNDKEGEEPLTGNIVFADLSAKYACVERFDTNGDGEVSIEEAEAATSFDGLFDDWGGVTSFDEICFFKNVHSLSGVFEGCDKLISITIPNNIIDLGTHAFSGCSSLTSVVLPSGITAIGDNTFNYCISLGSVSIPSTVTSIGQYAFSSCLSLSQVVIPDGVTSIGRYAFSDCSSLSQVVIPSGVASIPMRCFYGCSSLKSVTIPSGVVSIGDRAFDGVKMWKLDLPSSISSLGYSCFGKIVCIILPSTSPVSIQSDTFDSVQGIFVPSNLIGIYRLRTNWTNYSSKLHPIGTYKDKNEFALVTSGAVDMGTSVKWAAHNVGTTKPEEHGDYYAWGETNIKSDYSWSTYLDCPNRDGKSFTKYFIGEGGKTILDPEDDAAHVKWGGSWRTPKHEEWMELIVGCSWEWTTYEGTNGYYVFGIGSGNIIFLPAAGNRVATIIDYVGSFGHYWSSSLDMDDTGCALEARFSRTSFGGNAPASRDSGRSIRPVCD